MRLISGNQNELKNMTHKPFIYFGTPYVGRDTLAILVAQGFVPVLVVTSPDAPQGRGLTLTPSPTKAWAEEHSIPVFTPQKLDEEALAVIAGYGASYAIVVAYGKILPQVLIESFPDDVLNIHYSLLPKYRGASPVESALLHGETETGVSIQRMVYELDAGDLIASRTVAIEPTETTRELRPRLVTIGAELLAEILPAFERGELSGVPQDHASATHMGKIEKSEGELSLSGDALTNWNKYRAYAESPGTYFFIEKSGVSVRVKIKTATFVNGVFMPERIVPEGKNEMNYVDFVKN